MILLWLLLLAAVPEASAQSAFLLKPLVNGLDHASAISAAPTGFLFIVETNRNRVVEFDTLGRRVDSLGNFGFGNYQFDEPLDVDATNGLKIYISDNGNRRVQIYDRHFQYLATISAGRGHSSATSYSPTVLCVDNRGDLFFYDDESNDILRFDTYGKLDRAFNPQTMGTIRNPSAMIYSNSRLYLADPENKVIHVLSVQGNYLGFFAGADEVQGLTAGRSGIWIIDRKSLKEYSPQGRLIMVRKLSLSEDPVDIGILGDRLYILTPSELFMGKVPSPNR